MTCEDCGATETGVRLGDSDLCDRCADQRVARLMGWPELPDPPPPLVVPGPDGREHVLRFRLWRAPTGICAELEETDVAGVEGFRVAVLGDHDAPVSDLLDRVRDAATRRVGHQYLQRSEHRSGWEVKDTEVVGRFEWDDDFGAGSPYKVVVDGRTLSWHELGEALGSYEGWEFRIEVDDRIEDLRTDAEIVPFPGLDESTVAERTADGASAWTTTELKKTIAAYERELRDAGVSTSAIRTHIDRATRFVEWLGGESQPATRPVSGSLPEADVSLARQWADARNDRLPERAVGQIRYELDVGGQALTLYECRPPWRPEYGPEWTRFPIVRFRYTKARKEWATYWRDRNSKFHRYDPMPASRNLQDLIDAVEVDRSGIFWG